MIRASVNSAFATVGAREDIDGAVPLVAFCPHRGVDELDRIELTMEPAVARALARKLNRWAKLVSSR